MRHTFCSNWLALHKDVNKLVLQSGHTSVDTMWKHYHKGTSEAKAKKFWAIMPLSTVSNVVRVSAWTLQSERRINVPNEATGLSGHTTKS